MWESRLGLGCWHLRDAAFLKQAYDLGVKSFDTADIYQNGASEAKIGEFLQTVPRESVFIGSKIGRNFYKWKRPWYKFHREIFSDFREEYLVYALCQSLERLRTSYLDVLYLHNPNRLGMHNGKVFLDKMWREGFIRNRGASLHDLASGFQAVQLGFDVIQVKINPDEDEALRELVPLAKKYNIKIVVKEPLGRGKFGDRAEKVLNWLAKTSVDQVLVGTNDLSHLLAAKTILDKRA